MTALPEERLGQLRVGKLRALLGTRLGDVAAAEGSPMGEGAGLLTADGHAAVLIENAGPRSLGGPITWAVRRGATDLVAVVDADAAVAGALAREASWFDLPIAVERIVGTTSEPVEAMPYAAVDSADAVDGSGFVPMLLEAGCDVVVEHGVTKGEVRGLEVARVVPGPDGGPVLEVGVGRFDREISSMMFANVPTGEALAKAVEMVATYRTPGANIHPLRDLVPERWLRSVVLADPGLVGAVALAPADTTVEVQSLREAQPAAALGEAADGSPVVVVCTAGIDLDAVTLAADTRAALAPDAELVVCAPERSLVPAVRAVGARLLGPARFTAIPLPY